MSFCMQHIYIYTYIDAVFWLQNSDSRRVRHFHFKAWPDFGVPEDHSVLIQFVEMVRGKLASNSGPIVVHCRQVLSI